MTIQIGKAKHAVSRAGDFETRLIETTGCSVAEFAGMLTGYQTAFQVARALHPMLTDAMPINDLTAAIDAAGVDGVRHDVLALLTAAPEPAGKGARADGGA